MTRKQPKIKNAVYSKDKLIGINAYLEHNEHRMIFQELPKKMEVDVNIKRVEYIINLSDIRKPSSYYLIK
jgi:hypothetical protein